MFTEADVEKFTLTAAMSRFTLFTIAHTVLALGRGSRWGAVEATKPGLEDWTTHLLRRTEPRHRHVKDAYSMENMSHSTWQIRQLPQRLVCVGSSYQQMLAPSGVGSGSKHGERGGHKSPTREQMNVRNTHHHARRQHASGLDSHVVSCLGKYPTHSATTRIHHH